MWINLKTIFLDSLEQITYNFYRQGNWFLQGEFLLQTLKKNRDFKQVYTQGNSVATTYLVLYFLPNNRHVNRYGFSISKKIGKAVLRNKLRRRLKEIIRQEEKENSIKQGYDLIFIARKPVVKLDYWKIKDEVEKLFMSSSLGRK